MQAVLSASRFNMWRAVIAVMHADFIVRPHEINFVLENMRHVEMSEAQREILSGDLVTALPIDEVFYKITAPADKEDFFHFARAIAWSDGELDQREQDILLRLGAVQIGATDQGLMNQSLKSFEEIYLNEGRNEWKTRDKSVVNLVRHLLSGH